MRKTALGMGLLGLLAAGLAQAQGAMSPDQARGLDYLLKQSPADDVLKSRKLCATGGAQQATDSARSFGAAHTLAHAADECPTLLLRQARDGTLLLLYRDLLVELTGQAGGHEQFPAAIASSVMRGGDRVAIGNQRAARVTSALALDAGFTVAYRNGERAKPEMPTASMLRPITARCVQQQEPDLGLCYAAGFTLGARAVSGLPLLSP
jgi:hypothetical protein